MLEHANVYMDVDLFSDYTANNWPCFDGHNIRLDYRVSS